MFKAVEKMRFSFTNKIALVHAVVAETWKRGRDISLTLGFHCYTMIVFQKKKITQGAYIFIRKIISFIQKPLAASPISPIDYW